jgi:outer membrane protein insertion porin family
METKEERFLFDATFDEKKFSRDLDAIRKLYEDEGYFSVEVHRPQFFYEDGGEKAIIVIPITEGIRVVVGVAGNKAIGEKEIKDKLTIMKSHSYDEATIGENVGEIISLYKEKGYYLVQVEPEVRTFNEKKEVTITFNIREGWPVKIKGIEINGNEAFPDGLLIGQMDTKTDLNPLVDFLTGWGTMKDEVFANDLRKIRSFYRNNGYIEAEVTSHRFEFSPDGAELRASVDVHEGPQFHLGKIDLTGNLAFTSEELRKMVESQDGGVYNVGKFEADLDRLREFYGKGGYVNARLELETKIDEAKKVADLKVHIREGRQFFLESVRAEGNKATNYKVIRREIRIPDGGIFDTDEVRKSSRRLFNLRYFKSIALDVEPGELADRLVLVVRVEEDQTGTFNLSAGWNQDAGLSGSTSIGWRNMFGAGQEASIQGEIRTDIEEKAPPTYSLDAQFTEPWLLDAPVNFTVGGRFLYQPRPSFGYTENTREGRANLGFPVSVLEPEADRLFVGYRLGFTTFTDAIRELTPDTVDDVILDKGQGDYNKGQGVDFITSSLSLSLVRNSIDFSFDPGGGYYLSPAVEFAGLGGDNSFLKPEVDFRVYSKFPFDWVFGARLRGGWVTDPRSGKEENVIATERFRAGNVFTLRGYGDGLIFPLQYNQEGGAARLLANVEEKITIIPNTLKLIFFYDVGNVWSSAKDVSLRDLRHSVGVGVRIGIPLLGVLYLDYGWPIFYGWRNKDDDTFLQGYRDGSLHFNIGRSFDIMDGR